MIDVKHLPIARMKPLRESRCYFRLQCEVGPPNQAVDALGGFSIDEGGIFLAFLIHSAARCSASSSCSIVMILLTWFLARVICHSP